MAISWIQVLKKGLRLSKRKNASVTFEIDTVIGKNHKGALLTVNDRATGIAWIQRLKDRNAEKLADALIRVLKPFKGLIKTITADNGKEFSCHERISKELGAQVYFVRPYHSWERGANENMNGLIRQYFKKRSSFEKITNEDVRSIQDILNERPRKRFDFMTPKEKYHSIFNQKRL
ncbi:IS30 family transposase [Algivirga pacifica]|uniref:Integrase catalytic domain-containing protein n=1 Tax=Algivirga pacifica TaxID=1162670 RepID=A0ABP9CXI1_9BACT